MDSLLTNFNSQKQLRTLQKRKRLSQEFIFTKKPAISEKELNFNNFLKQNPLKKERTLLRDITNTLPNRNTNSSHSTEGENNSDLKSEANSICKSLDFWFKKEERNNRKENLKQETIDFGSAEIVEEKLKDPISKTFSFLRSDCESLDKDFTLKRNVRITSDFDIGFLGQPNFKAEQSAVLQTIGKTYKGDSRASEKQKTISRFMSSSLFWEYKCPNEFKQKPTRDSSYPLSLSQSFSYNLDKSFSESMSLDGHFSKKWAEWQSSLRSAYYLFKQSEELDSGFYLSESERTIAFLKVGDSTLAALNANSFLREDLAEENILFEDFFTVESRAKRNFRDLLELGEFEKQGGKIKRTNTFSRDHSDLGSLREAVLIRGKKEVHSLFDFLFNSPEKLFSSPPSILSAHPFKGARLAFLKPKVRGFRDMADNKRYSLEFDQICMPSLISKVLEAIKQYRSDGKLDCKMKPHLSSRGVNCALIGAIDGLDFIEKAKAIKRDLLDSLRCDKRLKRYLNNGVVEVNFGES